jgi:peptidyl-prolyl cis-trans isomerase B (cyclophilin B)
MTASLTTLFSVLLGLLGILQAPVAPKQAVVETSAGTFVVDLAPEQAPLTTAYFMKTAAAGGYNGTTFHKMLKYGIVQGGDPLSKDASKRAQWGTGGLNAVKDEPRTPKMTRGSVAAVTIPGKADSAGQQFFVAVVDQPGLDGKYTVFGHVSDGIEVVQKISETPIDEKGVATERVEIKSVTIRDTPPVLFVNDSVQDLAAYRAVLDTSAGPITIEFFPDKAKETVRQFLRLADAGVYNSVAFHRVAPGFVIQTGAMNMRATPLTEKQQKLVHNLAPEINDTKHVKGIVSMARDVSVPDSASTSFFIVTGTAPPALDGNYTAFGRVVDGMAAVEAIEQTPREGETPKTRVELRSIKVERK